MVQSNGNIKLVDYDNCRHIVSKQGDVVDCIGTPEFTGKEESTRLKHSCRGMCLNYLKTYIKRGGIV